MSNLASQKTALMQTMPNQTTDVPILVFDGSFEGWLTAVFVAYEQGWQRNLEGRLQNGAEVCMVPEADYIPSLWQAKFTVTTDLAKAQRVNDKLFAIFAKDGMRQLLWAFLSENSRVYTALFAVLHYQIANPHVDVWEHYTHPAVMQVSKLVKMVGRERHRMQAFVRFEHTKEDIYFARIAPDFNVLPLVAEHFTGRYADQSWAIYDVVRGYGLFYQKNHDKTLQLISEVDSNVLKNPGEIYSEKEQVYQQLWRRYFKSVTIKERYNPKLHTQMLPRRYWQYLTEKQGMNSIRFT